MIIKLQNGNILKLSKEESDYLNWKKLSPKQKQQSRINKAKAYLNSGPNITNFWNAFQSYIGNKDPKNPHLNIGIVNVPGRATPQQVQQSAKLMETINNYWKNLGKLKIRLSGGRATSGILTKPGTAPTTFNGQNINYITSPKGGNVTHKFYTDQGSEYILTKDGFARRVKSPHNNTLGQGSGPTEWNAANSDAGLHNWNEGTTIFTEGEDGKLFNTAFYKLSDFGFKPGTYGLARKGEKARIMLIDPKTKQWRAAMLSDVYPTTVKQGLQADRVMETNYSDVPKLGWHILEKANGGWHPGSPVAFIEGLKQGGIIKSANARKWKHKDGGKAFVNGVSILDNNSNAYKYVKKKYKMAQEGTKLNFWQKTGNFLNGGLGQTLMNGVAGVIKTTAENKNVDAQAKAAQAQNEADWTQMMNQIIKQNQEENNRNYMQWVSAYQNGLIQDQPSQIVAAHMGQEKLNQDLATGRQNLKNKNSQISSAARAAKSENWTNTFGNIVQQGMGTIGQLIGNNTNSGTTSSKTNFGTSDYKLQLPEIWNHPTIFSNK